MLSSLLSRDGRAVLEAIMQHVPSGLTLASAPDVTILRVSDFGSQLLGRPRAELEGIGEELHVDAYHIFHAETGARAQAKDLPLTRAVKSGEIVRDEEWLVADAQGNLVPILCNAGPIRDGRGNILGGLIAWTDLRAQKALQRALTDLLEQREDSIREVHHRVKNHLAIVASIIQMESMRHGPECQAFAEAVQRRMDVLAAVHSAACRSEDLHSIDAGEHLQRICEALSSEMHPVVVVSEAGLRLPNEQATVFALIANEAVCNALKHAFPEGRPGRVEVALRLRDGELVLTVTDDGVGPTKAPSGHRLGLILANGLARQLGGEITLRAGREGGAVFTLGFPHVPVSAATAEPR